MGKITTCSYPKYNNAYSNVLELISNYAQFTRIQHTRMVNYFTTRVLFNL
ncbi:hypothetical protein GQ55_4G227000 [Panicum hallii var. hallii]|uniref:Uncharacterized protein n=1 Tax=Panicum hallii var. hallii TaxID=1504633 RepID=A0A2T7DZG4_9POAL|nr:hypothetical protein GQ55_4G227000 [Panicum hallii var. hallii]